MKLLSALMLCIAVELAAPAVHAQTDAKKPQVVKKNGGAGAPRNGTLPNGLPETAMEKLASQEEKKSIFEDPLQGVIVNRTITVLGNDFYQYFTSYWNTVNQNSRYSIAIYERPTARWGSEIWIQFRQQRVFHTFLAPARQAAKDVAEAAANIVEQNIMRAELQRMTFIDQDLAPEEF